MASELRPLTDTEQVPGPQHLLGFLVHVLLNADVCVFSSPDRLNYLFHEPGDQAVLRLGLGHLVDVVRPRLWAHHRRGILQLVEGTGWGRDCAYFSPRPHDS